MKFFQLTRSERIGLVGVLVIFIVIILFKYFDPQVTIDYKPSSIEHIKEELPLIRQSYGEGKENIVFPPVQKVIHIAAFEKFNPNSVDFEYWKKLGFENTLALRLEKFIHSGQGVKNIDNLEKVYGMKKEWIELIQSNE